MNQIFRDKTILILGAMGVSGRAAARLCSALGAAVILSDAKDGPLHNDLSALKSAGAVMKDVRPRQDEALLDEVKPDFLVIAPGVPPSVPALKAARARGILVQGENDLAYYAIQNIWKTQPFVIAVTGTDGKSTTTALTAHILSRFARAVPCGNYGIPLSEIALNPDSADVLVVEVSSFQLETLVHFHAQCSMILNISEDHLDRYAGMEEYTAAKLRILNTARPEDLLLGPAQINARAAQYADQNRLSMPRALSPEAGAIPSVYAEALTLPGEHNKLNLAYALAAADDFAARTGKIVREDLVADAIRRFQALPHRLEVVCASADVSFVNDSKATTVQAVEAALRGFPGKHVFLLCGGKYKGGDFARLAGPDRTILAYGQAREILKEQLGLPLVYEKLQDAFTAAIGMAVSVPSVVLLSPGCSSYDSYESYVERGEHFRSLARKACGVDA